MGVRVRVRVWVRWREREIVSLLIGNFQYEKRFMPLAVDMCTVVFETNITLSPILGVCYIVSYMVCCRGPQQNSPKKRKQNTSAYAPQHKRC